MQLPSIFSINIQQIYVFLRAAEYENFSRVASEFNMTPPTVSRNIEALETELELILFIREKQRVRLTPAGKTIYEAWKRDILLMEEAVKKAQQIQKGNLNQLYIGDFNTTSATEYLLPIINEFEKSNVYVELHIDRTDPLAVLDGIIDRRYDVGFFSSAGISVMNELGLSYEELFKLDPVVIIPERHPLYEKEKIEKEDLEKETYVVLDDKYQTYWNCARAACLECGFNPHFFEVVSNAQSMIIQLEQGKCLAIMDDCYQPAYDIKSREFRLTESKTKFGFVVVYDKNNHNPNIAKFINSTKKVFSQS